MYVPRWIQSAKSFSTWETESFLLGAKTEREHIATEMLRHGEPINKIARYSNLHEDVIRRIAKIINDTID